MLVPRFITSTKAKDLLLQKDEYLDNLNQFNLDFFRFKNKEQLNQALSQCAQNWEPKYTLKIEQLFSLFNYRLMELYPNQKCSMDVNFILSNGQECGSPYTRSNCIVLIRQVLGSSHLVFHEMFHVISRQNPELRSYLYQELGFKSYEQDILNKHGIPFLLNPDAPKNDHYILINGLKTTAYTDNLMSREFKFLILDENDQIINKSDKRYNQTAQEYLNIFKPMEYVFHPEEILAEAWSSFWHNKLNISGMYVPKIKMDHFVIKAIQNALEKITLTK
jgi:hypothetical protein